MLEHLPEVITVLVLISTVIGSYYAARYSITSQGEAITSLVKTVSELVADLKIHEKRLDENDLWRAGSKGRQSECVAVTDTKFTAEIKSMNDENKIDSVAQWKHIDTSKSRLDVHDHRLKTLEETVKTINEKLDKILEFLAKGDK